MMLIYDKTISRNMLSIFKYYNSNWSLEYVYYETVLSKKKKNTHKMDATIHFIFAKKIAWN